MIFGLRAGFLGFGLYYYLWFDIIKSLAREHCFHLVEIGSRTTARMNLET